jgi:hypothetical protein
MSRRRFLKGIAGILAAGVAPAAIGSGVLMPIKKLWVPPEGYWVRYMFSMTPLGQEPDWKYSETWYAKGGEG